MEDRNKQILEYVIKHYQSEISREEGLHRKGQVYFSVSSLILTALLFKIKELRELTAGECGNGAIVALIFTLVFVFASLFLTVWSMRIKIFEEPTSSRKIHEEMSNNITLENFQERRIADMLTAAEKNSIVNTDTSKQLTYALYLMLIGYAFALFFIISIII